MQQKGQLVAVQCTDKWQVHIWSTNADPKRVAVQWISKNGMIEVQIPASVIKYNSAVFGVDLNDQNRSYYPIGRPGTKWWRYLFNYLVQVSMINSFILMKPARPNEGTAAVSITPGQGTDKRGCDSTAESTRHTNCEEPVQPQSYAQQDVCSEAAMLPMFQRRHEDGKRKDKRDNHRLSSL